MRTEAEMSERARALSIESRRVVAGESAVDVRQRAEGEFLRALVADLQPMLRESMRSHAIVIESNARGRVALESDGVFVHIDIADQRDAIDPLQVIRAMPSLLVVLLRIEGDLDAANDAGATRAADIVRLARYSLGIADVAP